MLVRFKLKESLHNVESYLKTLQGWDKYFNTIKIVVIETKEDLEALEELFSQPNLSEIDLILLEGGLVEGVEDEELMDVILLFSENNKTPHTNSIKVKERCDEITDFLEIPEVSLEKDYSKINELEDFDYSDNFVIHEIFEAPQRSKYSLLDFQLQMEIGDKVDLNGEEIDLEKGLLKALDLKHQLNKKAIKESLYSPFNLDIYLPITDINNINVSQLLEYKWEVFEKVKQIGPNNMQGLSRGVIDLCNSNEFIPYREIESILDGDYEMLKYYKGGV